MNQSRRRQVRSVIERLEVSIERVQDLYSQEHESFASMPYNLKASEKGELIEGHIIDLDEAKNCIEQSIRFLQKAIK